MRNDSIVQTSCKRTDLATIAGWLDLKGIRIRSMAELVRWTIEGMVDILEKNDFPRVQDTARATEILKSLGLADSLNPSKRYGRNLFKNILNTSLEQEKEEVGEIEKGVKRAMERWG